MGNSHAQDLRDGISISGIPDYTAHLVEDEALKVDGRTMDGLNFNTYVDCYTDGSKIYLLHQEDIYLGVYIDAIDVHTGDRVWRQYIGWRTHGYAVNMDKIEKTADGNVKVSGLRERSGMGSGLPDVYILDDETGKIVNNISRPEDDNGVSHISNSYIYLNFIDDRYFHIGRYEDKLISYSKDINGDEISRDTSYLDIPELWIHTFPIRDFVVDDRRALYLSGYRPEDFYNVNDSIYDYFASLDRTAILYDENLRYESTKVIDAALFPYAWNIRQTNEDLPHHQVLLCRDKFYPDKDAQRSALVFMNGSAEITHTFDFGHTGDLDAVVTEIDGDRFMVVTYSRLTDDLKFYEGRYDGSEPTLLSSHTATTDYRISIRDIRVTDDRVILILKDWVALWNIMLTYDDVGLLTSTEEVASSTASISPNPSQSYINLDDLDQSAIGNTYRIYGVTGDCLLRGVLDDTYRISISALPLGHYVLKMDGHQPLKFIKI